MYTGACHEYAVSIHALLAECDMIPRFPLYRERVSIHALLAECDYLSKRCGGQKRQFQSTHSLRSATPVYGGGKVVHVVSIHALLAECDLQYPTNNKTIESFNPRTPCGVRPICRFCIICIMRFNPRTPCGVRRNHPPGTTRNNEFQSTHSLRSATSFDVAPALEDLVSIHALLAECDTDRVCKGIEKARFQSTHSLRSATFLAALIYHTTEFQSTHSLRSAT